MMTMTTMNLKPLSGNSEFARTLATETLPDNIHPEQLAAIKGITAAFQDGNYAVLEGPAGTGKTFTLNAFRDRNWAQQINTVMSAMTHVAASHFKAGMTTHSALGLRMRRSPSGDKMVPGGRPKIHKGCTLVVDEASMADKHMAKMIHQVAVKEYDCKVLFVGDPYQLPPVKGVCPIFGNEKLPTFRLNQIHRQGAGNPIIELATQYRHAIDGKRDEPEFEHKVVDGDHGIIILDKDEFRRQQDLYYERDPRSVITLAYRNVRVNAHNKRLRFVTLGDAAGENRVLPGELLRANRMIMDRGQVLVPNNARIEVISVELAEDDHGVLGLNLETNWGWLFSPDSMKAAHAAVDGMRRDAKAMYDDPDTDDREANRAWAEYCSVRDSYADVRPWYASTVHKAQGSTIETVFIDLDDIYRNEDPEERLRMIYTALTRASKRVIVTT